MRRFAQTLAVLSVTPVALALPVVSRPTPAPRPVSPVVVERAVSGIDGASARGIPGWGNVAGPAPARPLALTRPVLTERPFSALGVTWVEGSADEVHVVARVRQQGAWSDWHVLDADPDHGPDDGTVDSNATTRGGTSPWFHGEADGYQVRVGVVEGPAPRDVRVSLVDPGESPADASMGASPVLGGDSAYASIGQPGYITRAQWGADERLRDGSPDYGDTIKMGFVHHTDSSNSYSMSGAASLVRSVYAFHTQSRGWSDIGYNFLVDKYGRIFEGRYGGVARPVIGAHTGGFNTDTFGASLLGNYSSTAPSSAQLGALAKLFAWKLGLHYVNPHGRTTMTSRGGSKYPEGQKVTLNNVSGHRDAGLTACPGNQTYNRLPTIRGAVKTYMGASLYYPSITATSTLYLTTTSVTVKSGVATTQAWRLDVRNARSGAIVRQISGSGTSISAVWNLKDTAGKAVPPDTYSLTLSSWTSKTKAKPYTVRVAVTSPLPAGVSTTHLDGTNNAFLEATGLAGVSPALASALRPTPAVKTFSGQRAGLAGITAGPRDGLFVKSATTGALYVIVDGARRPIGSATVSALGLTAPVTLPSPVLGVAPQGPSWSNAQRHPDGMVVKHSDGTHWRLESGTRRPFTSGSARYWWAKGLAVPTALPGDLALPLGPALAPPEGVVMRTADGGAGVVSGGAFRRLTDPAKLGYAVSSAPVASDLDLGALLTGDPVGVDKHPSGALLRSGSTYVEVLGDRKRVVPASLLPTDPRAAVAPVGTEIKALRAAPWTPSGGLAGRAADGSIRVVDNGRLVTLSPPVANSLGYDTAPLPALEAADFGPLPVGRALVRTDAHPMGTLVTDGAAVWLLDAGMRRLVAASLTQTYRGRPALPATSADLALPVGAVAPVASGAWVVTPDTVRWLVDRGVRRAVTATVAKRLGLSAVTPQPVVAADLDAATTKGSPVP